MSSVPESTPMTQSSPLPGLPLSNLRQSEIQNERNLNRQGKKMGEEKKENRGREEKKEKGGLAPSPQRAWARFLRAFGPGLVPTFSHDGRLLSALGSPGEGRPAPQSFSPQKSEQVALRAQQIIEGAQDLLGLDSKCPLERKAVQSGEISAQMYFREFYQGFQLEPVGSVKVDLGPKGELLGLYSDYVPEVHVTNRVVLNADEARERVPKTLNDPGRGLAKGSPAKPIVWVQGGVEGRFAYQFHANGYEVVIDAETGQVLFSKYRRIQ